MACNIIDSLNIASPFLVSKFDFVFVSIFVDPYFNVKLLKF